jgi:hypothetical protein
VKGSLPRAWHIDLLYQHSIDPVVRIEEVTGTANIRCAHAGPILFPRYKANIHYGNRIWSRT